VNHLSLTNESNFYWLDIDAIVQKQ
jgi:hypothetical protein